MKKKKQQKQEGAPLWMVTYGDMVTLLLTFFVMLLAMSEIKKDEHFIKFMEAIRQAFGYVGGQNFIPNDEIEIPRNVDIMQMFAVPVNPKAWSQSEAEGVRGKRPDTKTVRRERFLSSAPVSFKPLSAELTPEARQTVAEFAGSIRGHTTQLEVRGHCSNRDLSESRFDSHYDLSYQRARAVAEALIEGGVDPQRIVIQAAGTNTPVKTTAYTEPDREFNELVEILQIDKTVDEATG